VTTPPLGIIEGYFGAPWSWAERRATMRFLAPHGYRFFIYAPKADAFLRRRWRDPHPDADAAALASFAADCRSAGVEFGVGVTPFEAHFDFGASQRDAMRDKLAHLDSIGLDVLAILFDDMRGDLADLAARHLAIVEHAAATTRARRIVVCPGYYSDDPVLDRVFGARPANYLQDLGRGLDPKIEVFWTGEEVCSREYSPGHLDEVAERLRRRPTLWDNYPVNDGPRMSQYLHLRAFTGRPASIASRLAAHAINPALQPTLTCIPALTLAASYRERDGYRYGRAFLDAARTVVGSELAGTLQADVLSLQDSGLERLGERRAKLRAKYAAFDHPAAAEVVRWLDGGYAMGADELQTQ
jgi:hyaluronoglucosaminidase